MPTNIKIRKKHQPKGIIILHEDQDMIIVDKAPGLLTISTDREKEKTAYFGITNYVRKGNSKARARVFIVHRLDREVSGILLFAKSEAAKRNLQEQWDNVEKHYLALVHGSPKEPEGTFTSYLVENGVHNVHSTTNPNRGKLSHTQYKMLGQSKGISLLDINLLTGRKHQIRVHLSENNLPILGDEKYGGKHTIVRRLALHAKSIAFKHPHNGKPCFFETRIPHLFSRIAVSDAVDKTEHG